MIGNQHQSDGDGGVTIHMKHGGHSYMTSAEFDPIPPCQYDIHATSPPLVKANSISADVICAWPPVAKNRESQEEMCIEDG